ncbi:DUF2795 domain-containing protein [Methanosarcina hadiensis]|uniref:DUF2795 domain-containing protein n=1 Tax=Methanosarcina hadiensis TaxID=3078083 RepID=UPI003977D3CD
MRASASSIQDVFRSIQFPARKEQIIEQVRKQNASSDIIEDLQMLPDREYESADSLIQAIESSSQTAGGGGGKSQSFGGTGTGGSGGGGSSSGGGSQSFGGRGGT